MLKKMSLILLTSLLVSTNVAAQETDKGNSRAKEIESGVFQIKLTDEEVAKYYKKYGKSLETPDKSISGKILSDSNLINTEEYTDNEGNKHIVKYYRVSYKNSDVSKNIQTKITQNKSKQNGQKDMTIGPYAVTPEEGDVRIDIEFEQLEEGEDFDSSTKNYWSAFTSEYYKKYLDFASGYFISNPIAGYFTGEVLDDLQDGLKGKGDATAYYRLVTKMGQVYHDNRWEDYYETYQQEWYWKHEQISYNSDNTVKSAETKYYFPDDEGYLPIEWAYTEDFYDDDTIQEIALYQYSLDPDRSSPARDFIRYDKYRSNWSAKGEMDY